MSSPVDTAAFGKGSDTPSEISAKNQTIAPSDRSAAQNLTVPGSEMIQDSSFDRATSIKEVTPRGDSSFAREDLSDNSRILSESGLLDRDSQFGQSTMLDFSI